MESQKEHWNGIHGRKLSERPKYDLWLDKYEEILRKTEDNPIIDLGCGRGNNTLYLAERGYKVIACDISEAALESVREYIPGAETRRFDLMGGLPFDNDSAVVVIADLSLHYFSWKDTLYILEEIGRVLSKGGYLLCRVNSVRDINYGAGQGNLVEENYYEHDGRYKRFFDRGEIERLLSDWGLKYLDEYQMDRYELPKIVWEVAAARI